MAFLKKSKLWAAGIAIAMALTAASVSGCAGGEGGGPETAPAETATQAITDTQSHDPVSIDVWSFVNLPNEVQAMQDSMDRLQQKYPWLTVNLVNNKQDTDFTQAVTAGDAPDVFISWDPGSVAQFGINGSVIDMSALCASAGLDVSATFPSSSLQYTQYNGKQYALPLLVDAYALYYNKDMFAAAGITDTPKTLSDLTADIQKLTIKNPDGTIKQWGMTPPRSDYDVNSQWFSGGATGVQVYDANLQSTFSTDPTWTEILNWQKTVLDFYGKSNVDKFVAKYSDHTDDEQNPFASGVSAMEMNGEWHIGEMDSLTKPINYGIVPVPVPDSKADIYGAGAVMGNVIYISSQSQHQAEAFFVAQQLATDTQFVNDFATVMSNVPTTFDSLKTWDAPQTQPLWQVMMDIVSNPNSFYKALTPAGSEDLQPWTDFLSKWETGKVKPADLQAQLAQVDQQVATINQQAQQ